MTSDQLKSEAKPRGPARSPELERIGSTLGPYRLVAPLGAGGMATVFSAVHVGLEKRVAVKVLRERLVDDAELKKRFTREGMIASRVRHPHVVDVTDIGEDRGHVYLVMELLEGESLAARMSRFGSMSVTAVVDIVLPIIAALSAAHRAGIVHRDVKPENIFLARIGDRHESPKLLDFGISRIFGNTLLTDEHTILGTAHYMAPEQARAERHIDGRADQYALAVVVFEAICGQLPYASDAANVFELLAEAAQGRALSLASQWKHAPEGLSEVLGRALASARDDRYADVEDLGHALVSFASQNGARRFRELVEPSTSADALESGGPPSNRVRVEAPTLAADLASPSEPPGTTRRTRKPTLRGVVPSQRLPSLPGVPRDIPASERPLAPFPVPRLDRAWRLAPLVVLVAAGVGVASRRVEVPSVPAPVHVESTAPSIAPAPFETPVSVALDVEPSYAVISIDGRPTAVGALHASLPRDERHRVTVDAEGFVRWEAYVEDADLERAIALRPLDVVKGPLDD